MKLKPARCVHAGVFADCPESGQHAFETNVEAIELCGLQREI